MTTRGRLDWALKAMLIVAVVPIGGGVCSDDELVPVGEACDSIEDCAAEYRCEDGYCTNGCRSDAECGSPDLYCNIDYCVLRGPECSVDADCVPLMGSEPLVCCPGSARCLTETVCNGPPPCVADDECSGDMVCREGACVAPDSVGLTVTWTVNGGSPAEDCPPDASLAVMVAGGPAPAVVRCTAGQIELADIPFGDVAFISTLSTSLSGSTFEWEPVITSVIVDEDTDSIELELVAGKVLTVSWTVNGSTMSCPRDPGAGTLFGRGLVIATPPSGTPILSDPQDCPEGMTGASVAMPNGTYSVSVQLEDPWHPAMNMVTEIVDAELIVDDARPWYTTASVDVPCACCPNPPAGTSCR